MSVIERNNVAVSGEGEQVIMFAHGFGCDQNMWRFVAPAFVKSHKIVLFDYVGFGGSDLRAFDRQRYSSLMGYVEDVLEICEELQLKDVIFVGHSVSAMIGVLAANKAPNVFDRLVLIGPSPRYIDEEDYRGGFSRDDIEGLLDILDSNYLGWANSMAPTIMGNEDRPELGEELTNSFCRTDPAIAKEFARTTFLSDNRTDLPKLKHKALILQCAGDVIAPASVGEYVHAQIADSSLVYMKATGHCPNLSAPEETVAAIREFVQ